MYIRTYIQAIYFTNTTYVVAYSTHTGTGKAPLCVRLTTG